MVGWLAAFRWKEYRAVRKAHETLRRSGRCPHVWSSIRDPSGRTGSRFRGRLAPFEIRGMDVEFECVGFAPIE